MSVCPSKEDLYPCFCKGESIYCVGLDNELDLANAARSLLGQRVYTFNIEKSNFNFIPHDAFKGVKVEMINIMQSTLMALTDTDEAFSGLEDHLTKLYIDRCVLMKELDWSVFRNLQKLDSLTYRASELETIGQELMDIGAASVEYMNFAANKISYIHDRAFSRFENIKRLHLNNNEIKMLKRTMLPYPAMNLGILDISNNLIEQLSDDIFTNMPSLTYLNIRYNKLLVLNENTFSPIWGRLETLETLGNELQCDCRMSWLPLKRFKGYLEGTCASPPRVKGKALDKLTPKDLWCYM